MLVLTRKENETIRIGDDVVVKVVKTQGGRVRLAIEAPMEVPIQRGELAQKMGLASCEFVNCGD